MLVTEEYKDIETTAGMMRVRIFIPTTPSTVPGVAVFTEIYQITGPVSRFCTQIASQGYIVACCESYHEFLPLGTVIPYDVPGTKLPVATSGGILWAFAVTFNLLVIYNFGPTYLKLC